MTSCQYFRQELEDFEVRVCSRCDGLEFDRSRVFTSELKTLLAKHPTAADYFNRCRTTRERVERGLADFLELVEVMSDYVRCGGVCS